MIATPCHSGTVHVPFTVSLVDTVKMLTAGGYEVQWRTLCFSNFIHAAREKMAREFVASDYTDLLFVDDDMGWDVEGILRMLMADVDVVGAICPRRKDPSEWNVNLLSAPDGQRIQNGGLLECAYIGTALLRIRKPALYQMTGRFFDVAYEGDRIIGEDAWFCREYRRHGGRVWAYPDIKVSHTGPKTWVGTYSLRGDQNGR